MKIMTGFLLLVVALGALGLGLLWLVGAATGGEWDLEIAGTWMDGLLVGVLLITLAVTFMFVGVRLIRHPTHETTQRGY